MNINELIELYLQCNLEFESIYEIVVKPDTSVFNNRTLEGYCGIVIPIEGKAKFIVEQKEYNLEPGKILFAGSNLELDKEVLGKSEWKYALVHYRVLNNMNRKIPLDENHQLFNIGVARHNELYNITDQLKKNQEKNSKISELANKGLLYNLVELIITLAEECGDVVEDGQIQKIKSYINQNLANVITIQEIADEMGVDPKHLYYIFQKETGMCPKKYITKQRMQRAKELLLDGKYNVSEVGIMVGYEDPLYFSRIFKKNAGIAPSSFRDNFGINPWKI